MDVRCDKCGTEYEFDENRVGPNGVTVKCTNCGHVFKVRRASAPSRPAIPRASTAIGAGPQGGKEWLVRKPDGQMIAFRELTTLQKWIVEGRVQRDDEISKNGETWKRLGNIMELEPFFSVFEKAQTLNSLIQQQPVELRGSELLAAVNPMDGGQSHAYPIPSRSQILQADPLPSQLPSQIPQTLPQRPPPLPRSAPMPSLPGAPLPSDASMSAPLSAPNAPPSTGLAGPATLERTIEPAAPPASFHSATLDFPGSEDELDSDDPVASFERGQRNKRTLVGAVLLVGLGLGASIAVAMYGPEDNALRGIAIKYGLLAGEPADDGSAALIEQAQKHADQDTISSQTKAIDLLGQAQRKRLSDIELLADRATHVALLSNTYRRWATDLDEAANESQQATKDWQAAPPATRGPKPQGVDPEPTRTLAQSKRVQATDLLQQASPWIMQAESEAPDDPKTLRARAAMSAAAQSQGYAAQLSAAKAAFDKAGRTDPVLLYFSAEHHMDQGESGYAQARLQLNKALTARPSFMRARVLSARLHLLMGNLSQAEADLKAVQAAAPEHEEGKRLVALLGQVKAAAAAKAAEPVAAVEPEPVAKAPPAPKKDFNYWMKRADRLRRRDQTMKALNAYGRAAELRGSSAEVHVGKGWCLLDLERPHPALAAFDRAIRENSKFADAYYGRGEALRLMGKKTEAVEAYEAYLGRAPSGRERKVVQRRLAELSGS